MSFVSFDYAASAKKKTVYSFRPKLAVWQVSDHFSEKMKYARISSNARVLSGLFNVA